MAYTKAVIELSKNLVCGNCGCSFHGTPSQARHVKYGGSIPYCSTLCRSAGMAKRSAEIAIKHGRKPRKGVLAGPCPVCGKMYESHIDKKYCSLKCYNKSDEFKAMLAANYKKGNEATKKKFDAIMTRSCPVCGKEYRAKRTKIKFCSHICYRQFRADLFDAWTANPKTIAMPQNYDEFMVQNKLPCLIEGCDWSGDHLSVHLNTAHGVLSADFKRAAGFNLSTGLVSPHTHRKLSDRANVLVGLNRLDVEKKKSRGNVSGYISNERREHSAKARMLSGSGPERECINCGKEFVQSTPYGRAKYCSAKCGRQYRADSRGDG